MRTYRIQDLLEKHMLDYLRKGITSTSEKIKSSIYEYKIPLGVDLFLPTGGLTPDFALRSSLFVEVNTWEDFVEVFRMNNDIKRDLEYVPDEKLIRRKGGQRPDYVRHRLIANHGIKQLKFKVQNVGSFLTFSENSMGLWLLQLITNPRDNGVITKFANYRTPGGTINSNEINYADGNGIDNFTSLPYGYFNSNNNGTVTTLKDKVIRMTIETEYDLKFEVFENGNFINWFNLRPLNIRYNKTMRDEDKRLLKMNAIGINPGISSSEIRGMSDVSRMMAEVEAMYKEKVETPPPAPTEKYAVVVIAGEANAVGLDCSSSDYDNHLPNPRTKQLGLYNQHNLRVSEYSWPHQLQDTDLYRNTGSGHTDIPLRDLGHDLSVAILPHIPSDYKVLVVNVSHSGTGFTTEFPNGKCDPKTLKPVPLMCKWGLNTGYYETLLKRIEFAMNLNPEENIFLGMIWMQGESDIRKPKEQITAFNRMIIDFENRMSARWGQRRTLTNHWVFPVIATQFWRDKPGYQEIWNNYTTRYPLSYIIPSTASGHSRTFYNMQQHPMENLAAIYGDGAFGSMTPEIVAKMFNRN